MKADIHPDGTLRIKPESMTEQTALVNWQKAMQIPSPISQGLVFKKGALALLAFTPSSGKVAT